jgi:hypothetical protein
LWIEKSCLYRDGDKTSQTLVEAQALEDAAMTVTDRPDQTTDR